MWLYPLFAYEYSPLISSVLLTSFPHKVIILSHWAWGDDKSKLQPYPSSYASFSWFPSKEILSKQQSFQHHECDEIMSVFNVCSKRCACLMILISKVAFCPSCQPWNRSAASSCSHTATHHSKIISSQILPVSSENLEECRTSVHLWSITSPKIFSCISLLSIFMSNWSNRRNKWGHMFLNLNGLSTDCQSCVFWNYPTYL